MLAVEISFEPWLLIPWEGISFTASSGGLIINIDEQNHRIFSRN